MQQKKQLRQYYRQRRRAISPEEQRKNARELAANFSQHFLFTQNNFFACYSAFDGELCLSPLLELIWKAGKQCYLPRIKSDNTMQFVLYQSDERLIKNQWGILESQTNHTIDAKVLDVVLMPLVAFDQSGSRLGMGAGYYDAAFSFRKEKHATAPLLVGVAHSSQECEKLPADSWDIPLDFIATEKAIKKL